MAYSTQRATSDGTLAYLDLTIGYIKRADISVFYNSLPANPSTWSWAGTTDKRINFSPVIAAGVQVLLVRKTQINGIIHVFSLGAKFNNSTMDQDFTQLLYLNQEAVEGAALTDIFTNVDFHGNRIVNLGDAVDDSDAVSKRMVVALTSAAVDASAASATAAAGSATSAAGSASAAGGYSDLAKDWATKLVTTVDGVDYSAKYWAQAASGVVNNLVPRTSGTGSAVLPTGTTGQRDVSPSIGYFRANTTTGLLEWWNSSAWVSIGLLDARFSLSGTTLTTTDTLVASILASKNGANTNSVRTNADGSLDILIAGTPRLSISATGVVTYGQQRVTGTIVSGMVTLPAPAWATKFTLVIKGLAMSTGAVAFLRGVEAAGAISTGNIGAVGVIAGNGAVASGTISTAYNPLVGGMDQTATLSGQWDYIKVGTLWSGKGISSRSDSSTYFTYGSFTAATLLTALQISVTSGNVTGGSYDVVFE